MPFKDATRKSKYDKQYNQTHKAEKTERDRQYYRYRKSGGAKLGHHRKASDNELLESYSRLGNIWKVANEFGMAGQTVWQHLKQLGITDKDKWTKEQLNILKTAYNISDTATLNINDLTKRLGRIKSNVCRKAKELGLSTNRFRKRSSEMSERIGERTKTWIRVNGHPRGNYKTGKQVRICIICGRFFECYPSQTNKYCSKKCSSNHLPCQWNKNYSIAGKRIDLNNQYFRSTYEANYARYLNFLINNKLTDITRWEYEATKFNFSKVRTRPYIYTPDFKIYFKENNIEYHEIKGWDYPQGIKARKRFNKYYPQINLVFIGKDFFYNAIHNGLAKDIPNWEYPKQYKKKEKTK